MVKILAVTAVTAVIAVTNIRADSDSDIYIYIYIEIKAQLRGRHRPNCINIKAHTTHRGVRLLSISRPSHAINALIINITAHLRSRQRPNIMINSNSPHYATTNTNNNNTTNNNTNNNNTNNNNNDNNSLFSFFSSGEITPPRGGSREAKLGLVTVCTKAGVHDRPTCLCLWSMRST